jgi:outer membrane protein W
MQRSVIFMARGHTPCYNAASFQCSANLGDANAPHPKGRSTWQIFWPRPFPGRKLKMKSKKSITQFISVGALAAVVTSFGYLPSARSEMVYEPEVSQTAPTAVRADDRDQMRTALQSSEKVQTTVQAQPAQQVQVQQVQPVQVQQPVQQVQVQPVQAQAMQAQAPQIQYVAPVAQPVVVSSVASPSQIAEAPIPAVQGGVSTSEAPQTEVQSLSKTELMRRERTRTELKNEDLLQERLEELRLRDEKRRTDQLLGAENNQLGGTAAPVMAPVAETTQGVVSPVTDHPGEVLNAPVPTAAQAQAQAPAPAQGQAVAAYVASPYTPAAQAQMAGNQSVTSAQAVPGSSDDHTKLYITPRFGVSVMNVDNAFNVSGKYSAGVGLGMGITDNLSFEVGYTYSSYGIGLGGANSVYASAFTGSSDTYVLNQNVFDAGLKLALLGPDSRFRPFVGVGAAYAKGYLNYPQASAQQYQLLNPNFSPDFESSDFLGYLSVGFDAQVSKTVSVGMNARYYKVLSDSENESLYAGSFYGGGYGGGAIDPAKLQEGTALAESSFYSLLGTVTFQF